MWVLPNPVDVNPRLKPRIGYACSKFGCEREVAMTGEEVGAIDFRLQQFRRWLALERQQSR
jgi:hypothetical protein